MFSYYFIGYLKQAIEEFKLATVELERKIEEANEHKYVFFQNSYLKRCERALKLVFYLVTARCMCLMIM